MPQAFRDGLDAGSFREGLEGLRSDLVNKAVQHRALAKNISSDVLEPLTELRGQLSSKTKALVAKATKLQRDTRAADEKYRRSHTRYHRCHREAALSLSAAVEGGAVPSSEPRRRPSLERSSTTPESTTSNSNSGGGGRRPAAADTLPPSPLAGAGAPAPPLRRRAMSATLDKVREAMPSASNKKDLVQWFLPSEKTRKEALIESAQAAADAAEEARKACLACWVALRSGVHSAVQEFQRVLTDFQGCEEQLVSEAQDGMRKHVVFESSSLANQQYDLQMLFKLMEAVNVEMDLRNFIRSARREVASDSVAAAAAARKEDAVGVAAASAPGSAASPVEAANGIGLGAGGGRGGAGVLSSRADRRGAALALQRLFGVGQDLPPPPTEEAWVPPEVEGETPAACRQTLVELFHAPLITKEDISMYLDATDPVAGAAASEAAAAAIKALGAPTLAGGARGAAAQDAKMDAALAKLSSHYPVVTPAASVYEVLGFAAQARHAKNYKNLLADASDAGLGDGGVGGRDGGSGGGERGDAEGRVSQPPLPCPDAGAAAGAAASEQRGGAADGENAPEGSNSSDVAGPRGGNDENTGDTAVSPAAAPAEVPAADDSGDSASSSGANAEKAASSSDGVVSGKPGSSSSSREGLDEGVIGGVAAAFADAVAAFTAADSSTPQLDQEPRSESPTKTAVEEMPTVTPAATPVAATSASATPEAATPAPAPAPAPVPEEDLQPPSAAVDPQGEDSPSAADPPTAAAATPTAKTSTEGRCSSSSSSKSKSSHVSKSAAAAVTVSPCLALASRRPSVFAATLADDVLESLRADGAGATERRGSEFLVVAGEEEEAKSGGGGEGPGGGDDRDGDPATAVARAVEALLTGGGGRTMKAEEVDAAAEACSESPSSSNRLLLALCQHVCASTTTTASGDNQGPSATTGSGSTGGGSGPGGFAPVRLQPASFVALARLLRASLDQAASDREFLQARNCLVTAGLFAVDGGDYVSWLREQDGSQQGKSGGGGGGNNIPAVMADSELVSAAGKLDEASAAAAASAAPAADVPGGEGAGEADEEAAGYLLLRELRRHPVWAAIELWEVSMSDSVVMAMEGGGARAERWLTRDTLDAMRECFGEDAASRQLDVKLGQLAFLGHSMLACGVPPSEVSSV
ncbi:unnamed protein product, partial [Ectocarpus sp. 8 AP-2014]